MNDENKKPEDQEAASDMTEETSVSEQTEQEDQIAATAESTEEAEAVEENQEISFEGEAVGTESEVKTNKQIKLIAIIAVAAVVVIAAVVAFIIFGKSLFNPYTKDYIDVTGMTVGEIADQQGMEFADFLEMYDLPSDMPASTSENAAYYNIPAAKFAEMSGVDFNALKDMLGLADDSSITEETTIGDVFDKTTVGSRVGEEQLDSFKAEYGLDESVTADTPWVEVRNKVDQKLKEQNEAAKNPVKETDEPEDEAEGAADTEEVTEATDVENASAGTEE